MKAFLAFVSVIFGSFVYAQSGGGCDKTTQRVDTCRESPENCQAEDDDNSDGAFTSQVSNSIPNQDAQINGAANDKYKALNNAFQNLSNAMNKCHQACEQEASELGQNTPPDKQNGQEFKQKTKDLHDRADACKYGQKNGKNDKNVARLDTWTQQKAEALTEASDATAHSGLTNDQNQ